MRSALLSFATDRYVEPMRRLMHSAAPWFDEFRPMTPWGLPSDFLARHADQLRYCRGWGFWAFKPYIILRTLELMDPADVLMYCDSQLVVIADPAPLFDLCQRLGGVLLFHQRREGRRNWEWTRRECFERMGCNEAKYWAGDQLNAAMSVWQNTPAAIRLLAEWYRWCSDLDVVGDGRPGELNHAEFKDHRHDQSILSLLAIRDGLQTFPDPSQFGVGYEQAGRNYGQVVEFRRIVWADYPIPCQEPSV